MPKILVDSWAWLALNYQGDQDYHKATTTNNSLLAQDYHYVTTNFILDETYTLLRRRTYAQRAVQFGNEIQQIAKAGNLEIVTLSPDMEKQAWSIFAKYLDLKGLSYTDCTSFAVMKYFAISEAFTNDQHFRVMGFHCHPT